MLKQRGNEGGNTNEEVLPRVQHYIGAAWKRGDCEGPRPYYPNCVGNSGLSLISRAKMLELMKQIRATAPPTLISAPRHEIGHSQYCFWDINTGISTGAMPYRRDFPATTRI